MPSRWEDLLAERLDAVLIATSGDHAPIAIEAARAGRHVLVEKPMALTSADAERMVGAAGDAGVCLMVGTMKRYDPAYERLSQLLPAACANCNHFEGVVEKAPIWGPIDQAT